MTRSTTSSIAARGCNASSTSYRAIGQPSCVILEQKNHPGGWFSFATLDQVRATSAKKPPTYVRLCFFVRLRPLIDIMTANSLHAKHHDSITQDYSLSMRQNMQMQISRLYKGATLSPPAPDDVKSIDRTASCYKPASVGFGRISIAAGRRSATGGKAADKLTNKNPHGLRAGFRLSSSDFTSCPAEPSSCPSRPC